MVGFHFRQAHRCWFIYCGVISLWIAWQHTDYTGMSRRMNVATLFRKVCVCVYSFGVVFAGLWAGSSYCSLERYYNPMWPRTARRGGRAAFQAGRPCWSIVNHASFRWPSQTSAVNGAPAGVVPGLFASTSRPVLSMHKLWGQSWRKNMMSCMW